MAQLTSAANDSCGQCVSDYSAAVLQLFSLCPNTGKGEGLEGVWVLSSRGLVPLVVCDSLSLVLLLED